MLRGQVSSCRLVRVGQALLGLRFGHRGGRGRGGLAAIFRQRLTGEKDRLLSTAGSRRSAGARAFGAAIVEAALLKSTMLGATFWASGLESAMLRAALVVAARIVALRVALRRGVLGWWKVAAALTTLRAPAASASAATSPTAPATSVSAAIATAAKVLSATIVAIPAAIIALRIFLCRIVMRRKILRRGSVRSGLTLLDRVDVRLRLVMGVRFAPSVMPFRCALFERVLFGMRGFVIEVFFVRVFVGVFFTRNIKMYSFDSGLVSLMLCGVGVA